MDYLPDLETIATLLSVVEARDSTSTPVWRFDEDHNVLLATQAELVQMLSSVLPASYDKDDLRTLLDRIDNDIENNRAARKAAMVREIAEHR